MKTREQKIMQAIRIYKKIYISNGMTKKFNTMDKIANFIIESVNNPDLFLVGPCDFVKMSVDEIYEGLMKQNIIYL